MPLQLAAPPGSRVAPLIAALAIAWLGIATQASAFITGGTSEAPLALVANRGQWRSSTIFAGHTSLGAVRLEHDGLVLRRDDQEGSRDVLALRLRGVDVVDIVMGKPLPQVHHFLLGDDRARWRTHVPAAAEVTYVLSSGASIRAHGTTQGLCLSMEPGQVAPDSLSLEIASVGTWNAAWHGFEFVEDDGIAVLEMGGTDGSGSDPTRSWRVEPGPEGSMRLSPPASDIPEDLSLEWATFLGGSGTDVLNDMAIGGEGRVVVVGRAVSHDFPTTDGGISPEPPSGSNGFISILSEDGSSLLSSTYFGGSAGDRVVSVDVANDGSLVVGGTTQSSDFPVTPGAFSTTKSGSTDLYIARLTPEADDILAASYIGGPALNPPEQVRDVAAAPNGDMVLVGDVPDGFPTTPGAFQPTFGGGTDDAFITRFTSDATALVFSTYLGTTAVESVHSVQVDDDGEITVVGATGSADFPVTPGAISGPPGTSAFVTRLAADGASLVYSATFGGSGADTAVAFHEAADGTLTIAGRTTSDDFPVTPGAFDLTLEENLFQINWDLFLIRLAPQATAIEWATYLGTVLPEFGFVGLAVDSAGTPTVVGGTPSQFFPTTPGAHHQDGGTFATRFHRSGNRLLYSTLSLTSYINDKDLYPAHLDPMGSLIIAGSAIDGSLTTPGSYDETANGFEDGHVAKLAMLPVGVTRFGASTPSTQGEIAAGVLAMPWQGNLSFGLTATNGPPTAPGWLLLGTAALPAPIPAVGAALWLDPTAVLGLVAVQTDSVGYVELRVPIPDAPVLLGMEAFVEFVFPPGAGSGGSATNALRLVVQPMPE